MTQKSFNSAALAMGFAAAIGASPAEAAVVGDPIKVDGGLVAGAWVDNASTRVYRAIPFAAPPVGPLRWKAPAPVVAWSGVRDGKAFSNQCVQTGSRAGSLYVEYRGNSAASEDCLYLNIWAPAAEAGQKLPVMVWLHGGAYTNGSGHMPTFAENNLARRGVVLVTVNYRLGAFGFLAHPALSAESPNKASGNYGLMDQTAALAWVQRNIARFGGDPGNVTLFGQSAGAGALTMQMASPRSRGLFQKAGAMSFGLSDSMDALPQAEAKGVEFQHALKAVSLDEMRALPASAVLEASRTQAVNRPIVDGWFLDKEPLVSFQQGEQAPVPLLAGWTKDEGTVFPHIDDAGRYAEFVRKRFGSQAARIASDYPAADNDQAKWASIALNRDQTFAWGVWSAARLQARAKAPVYVYHYLRDVPFYPDQTFSDLSPTPRLGAHHSSDYPYLFGTLHTVNRAWTADDRRISDFLQQSWTNFAKTGNPNASGSSAWPRFEDGRETVQYIDASPRVGPVPRLDQLRVIDAAVVERRGRFAGSGG